MKETNNVRERSWCHACEAREGEFHELYCTQERCPFCGGQLASCDCSYEMLNLFDEQKYDDTTSNLPPEIYNDGLPEDLEEKWLTILNEKGRVPFIEYPVVCAKCGVLYPEFFRVSDEEWQEYIQMDMRDQVICRECYDYIKSVIDKCVKKST